MDQLEQKYKVSQRDKLHHFLSLKITWNIPERYVYLSQEHYIDKLRAQYLPTLFPSVKTPTLSTFKDLDRRKDSEMASPGPYPSLIGALLWIAQSTWADISFAVNCLLQFLRDPSAAHWHAALRILQYLVSTKDYQLWLGGNLKCCGYSDSDWAADLFDRRSTSAYTYCIGAGSI